MPKDASRATKAAQAHFGLRPSTSSLDSFLPAITKACSRIFWSGQGPDRRLSADGRDADNGEIFKSSSAEYDEFKTFFHGHSYTANQLGAAASLASLEILLQNSRSIRRAAQSWSKHLRAELQTLWALPNVGDIRQVGLIAGIELVKNWRTRAPFGLHERAGIRVCEAMARRGVLTRPIGNVIVLMPPYCTTPAQLRKMIAALGDGVKATLRS